jgi:cytochrome P450
MLYAGDVFLFANAISELEPVPLRNQLVKGESAGGRLWILTMPCPIAHSQEDRAAAAPVSLSRYPKESLLLGSGRAYVRNGLDYYQRCERIAGIVQTRLAWKRAYIVTDPVAIADVLVNQHSHFIKPYVLRRMRVIFGDGLITSTGETWRHHRRLMQPAFGSDRVSAFMETVSRNTEEMLSSWRNGEVRDIYADLTTLCMKNVAEDLFGVYDDELRVISRRLTSLCHELLHGIFDVIRPMPFRFRGSLLRKVEQLRGDLERYIGRLIDQRRGQLPRRDFLGLLISGTEQYPALSRKEIVDESITMLLGGHETTTSALAWGLHLLARHPQEADSLARDLDAALHGEAPQHFELEKLESLAGTVDEIFRLYPPTHRIARTVDKPAMVGGHRLSVGADVIIPQWAVHRSRRWYQDPEAFLPSRWTRSFRKALPKFAYFPFSGGARTCVGAQFAWCESAVILALMVQRFRFSVRDSAPLVPYEGLTLIPTAGQLWLRIEHRRPATMVRKLELLNPVVSA